VKITPRGCLAEEGDAAFLGCILRSGTSGTSSLERPRKPPPAEQPPLHAQPPEVDAEAWAEVWAEATMQPQMKDEDDPQKTMNIFLT
jgi:hypothetical protein